MQLATHPNINVNTGNWPMQCNASGKCTIIHYQNVLFLLHSRSTYFKWSDKVIECGLGGVWWCLYLGNVKAWCELGSQANLWLRTQRSGRPGGDDEPGLGNITRLPPASIHFLNLSIFSRRLCEGRTREARQKQDQLDRWSIRSSPRHGTSVQGMRYCFSLM